MTTAQSHFVTVKQLYDLSKLKRRFDTTEFVPRELLPAIGATTFAYLLAHAEHEAVIEPHYSFPMVHNGERYQFAVTIIPSPEDEDGEQLCLIHVARNLNVK
jgi:hypothetical protein